MAHGVEQRLWIRNGQLKMLRGQRVDHRCGVHQVTHQDDCAIGVPARPRGCFACQLRELGLNLSGHGIGKVFHEEPQVLHYGKAGTGLELKAGMTFTIEPMINAGRPEIRELADGWTIVTKDHSLSAQWEHTVLVTETGFEVLTISEGSPDRERRRPS